MLRAIAAATRTALRTRTARLLAVGIETGVGVIGREARRVARVAVGVLALALTLTLRLTLPTCRAAALAALSDGLQIQWLRAPDQVDVEAVFDAYLLRLASCIKA